MSKNQNRIIIFSPALYNRHTVAEIIMYANGAIKEEHQMKIGEKYFTLLRKFNSCDLKDQRIMLKTDLEHIVRAHVSAIVNLDAHKETLNYMLFSLDGIIFERPECIEFIYKQREEDPQLDLIEKLQKILSKNNTFFNTNTLDAAANILSVLISDHDHYQFFENDVTIHINHIIGSSLKSSRTLSDYIVCVCLSRLLLVPGKTEYFVESSGIDLLKSILEKNESDMQIVYYVLLNIWILTFDHKICAKFGNPRLRFIPNIINALKKISREKLSRVAFKILRNLSIVPECIELMVDNDLRKVVDNELRKNIKDEFLKEDLEFILDILEKNYRILSSFEKYTKELATGKLGWGPCHSENFWKEHVKKFEKNDFQLINTLVQLLDSKDILTRAIACYDLGEFCRFHHFAKTVLEGNNGKAKLMAMIQEDEGVVREQALLAVQKMVIHNWQSLRA